MKRIILIANSDYVYDINNHISNNDVIVRFNIPKNSTIQPTGNRTDYLFVANTCDLANKKFKKNSKFMKFTSALSTDTKIIFPYSDNLIKKINPDWTKKNLFTTVKKPNWNNIYYKEFIENHGFTASILDENIYWDAINSIHNSENILSTGFLALYYFLTNPNFNDFKICLHGFSFEGWAGHNWTGEKEYITQLEKDNKICILPLNKVV